MNFFSSRRVVICLISTAIIIKLHNLATKVHFFNGICKLNDKKIGKPPQNLSTTAQNRLYLSSKKYTETAGKVGMVSEW